MAVRVWRRRFRRVQDARERGCGTSLVEGTIEKAQLWLRRSRAFTKKTAKVQKMGIFTSPQKLRRGGSIVSLSWPGAEFISAIHTGVILALRSKMRAGGTGLPPGPSTREKTSRYSRPSEPMRSVR